MPNNSPDWIATRRNEARAANYAQTRANATNGHQRWSQEEDRAVMYRGVGGRSMTDRELSEKIGRSVQAIQVRRTRLGAS